MSGRGLSLKSKLLIQTSYEILEQIQPASVRAVCYQLFTRGAIASMKTAETQKVSRLLTGNCCRTKLASVVIAGFYVDRARGAYDFLTPGESSGEEEYSAEKVAAAISAYREAIAFSTQPSNIFNRKIRLKRGSAISARLATTSAPHPRCFSRPSRHGPNIAANGRALNAA
jgi:hypothetical protein